MSSTHERRGLSMKNVRLRLAGGGAAHRGGAPWARPGGGLGGGAGGPPGRAPAEDAAGFILGYTAANDVTARDLQQRDGQWGRAKGFDTFCPLGPAIETELDPTGLAIPCPGNGEIRQQGNTADMGFGVGELLAF